MNKSVKWIVGGCAVVGLLGTVAVIVLVGWFAKKSITSIQTMVTEMPDGEVKGGQVIVTNPSGHPLTNVSVQIDGTTRAEPVQHIFYNISAGNIAPHSKFTAPVTNAKSGGGIRFDPAKMKVWGVKVQGSDNKGSSWSTGSSGGGPFNGTE